MIAQRRDVSTVVDYTLASPCLGFPGQRDDAGAGDTGRKVRVMAGIFEALSPAEAAELEAKLRTGETKSITAARQAAGNDVMRLIRVAVVARALIDDIVRARFRARVTA
jgi:hypothetical protein